VCPIEVAKARSTIAYQVWHPRNQDDLEIHTKELRNRFEALKIKAEKAKLAASKAKS
jgi:hypothetical protein